MQALKPIRSRREGSSPWFSARYPAAEERAAKFEVFMAIAEYLSEYGKQLDNAGAIVMGSDTHLIHGSKGKRPKRSRFKASALLRAAMKAPKRRSCLIESA